MKIRKATFQHVEAELRDYEFTKREIIRLKDEILHGGRMEKVSGGSNLPSDPTGQIVIRMLTHRKLEQMQRVVDAIDYVMSEVPENKKELIRLKYWKKSRMLTWDGIAQEIHVSRRQAINWRNDIVRAIAEKIGWQ